MRPTCLGQTLLSGSSGTQPTTTHKPSAVLTPTRVPKADLGKVAKRGTVLTGKGHLQRSTEKVTLLLNTQQCMVLTRAVWAREACRGSSSALAGQRLKRTENGRSAMPREPCPVVEGPPAGTSQVSNLTWKGKGARDQLLPFTPFLFFDPSRPWKS